VALEQLPGGWAYPLRPRGTWAPAWSAHVALESYLSAEHTWCWGCTGCDPCPRSTWGPLALGYCHWTQGK